MPATYLQDARQRFTEFGGFTPVEPAELPEAAANWADGVLVRTEPGLTTLVALVTVAPEGSMRAVRDDLVAMAEEIIRQERTEVQAVMLLITPEPLTRQLYDRWQELTVSRGPVRLAPWVVDVARGRLFTHQGPPFGIDPDLETLAAPVLSAAEVQAPVSRPRRRAIGDQPLGTIVLLGIIIGVWLLMTAIGGSLDATEQTGVLHDWGAVIRPDMWIDHEYWRMFTAMFLHIGLVHLAVNGYSLWVVGRTVEILYGRFKLIVIFLIAGVAGSVLSALVGPPSVAGAGASGAIFGLLGAVVWYRLSSPLGERILMRPLLTTLALNLALGLALHNFIDNWNHAGGLVGGFLFAAVVGVPAIGGLPAPRWRLSRTLRAVAAGLVVVIIGVILSGLVELPGPGRDLARALQALDEGRLTEAQSGLERAAARQPDDADIRYYLVKAYALQGKCTEAFGQLRVLKQLAPDDPDVNDLEQRLRSDCKTAS